jgi:uncharacterized SAM-binding protein YcdF (DUF218 family)
LFLFKKIAGELLAPLSVVLVAAAVGLVLLWFTRRQRLGKLVATAAFLLLITMAYGWLGGPALHALERDYAPMASPPAGIKWIVVLGGGAYADPELPTLWRAHEATLARTVEGVRLQRRLPDAKLVLSGGPVFGSGSDAEVMSAMAIELGVARERIVMEGASTDTEGQARVVRELLKGERCILVTSAVHMRRSLALFRKQGIDALPAPTHYLSQSSPGIRPGDFFPRAGRIQGADAAAHEFLGLAWHWLTGRI